MVGSSAASSAAPAAGNRKFKLLSSMFVMAVMTTLLVLASGVTADRHAQRRKLVQATADARGQIVRHRAFAG